MIVTEIKRVVLKINKYYKQLWLKLNNTYNLTKKKIKAYLYHGSNRDEENHIESKKIS